MCVCVREIALRLFIPFIKRVIIQNSFLTFNCSSSTIIKLFKCMNHFVVAQSLLVNLLPFLSVSKAIVNSERSVSLFPVALLKQHIIIQNVFLTVLTFNF